MRRILVTGLKGGVGRTTVAESLRHVAHADGLEVEVTDGHARLNCDLRHKAQAADLALIVVEPGVFGRLDLSFLVKVLKDQGTACTVLVNRADPDRDPDPELIALCEELGVGLSGAVAFNRYFARILAEGKVLAEEDRDTARTMRAVLEEVGA